MGYKDDCWLHEDAVVFKKQVIDKLSEIGFTIKNDGPFTASYIVGKDKNDKTNLYLHPLEFTGYMKLEDVEKILSVLENCTCTSVSKAEFFYAYDISDDEYRDILTAHSKDILSFVREYWKKEASVINCVLNFVSQYRIPRAGDSCILSQNVAYGWVKNFINIVNALGIISSDSIL